MIHPAWRAFAAATDYTYDRHAVSRCDSTRVAFGTYPARSEHEGGLIFLEGGDVQGARETEVGTRADALDLLGEVDEGRHVGVRAGAGKMRISTMS